jgi:hypothetical protein
MSEQRWLSLDGLCTILKMNRKQVLWLAKQGFIPVIWGRGRRKIRDARFLDPTPEYAQKLILGEAAYGRMFPVPKTLALTGLLSVAEVAEIMGWTVKYAQYFLIYRYKVPSIKLGEKRSKGSNVGLCNLYTVQAIRNVLWKRGGRKHGQYRGPFLLEDLIKFFRSYYAKECEEVPTDAQFAEDDLLQRKLARLVEMDNPAAMQSFYDKVALAKKVVELLKSAP